MTPSVSLDARFGRWQRIALIVGVVATVVALVDLLLDRDEFLRSYLYGYLYWTGMGLGCLAILMMHHVVGGKWGMPIRRMCEAGARTLPFMGLLLIPILLSVRILYPWSQPEAISDANVQAKTFYLNIPFFVGRAVFYFAIWFLYSYLLSKWSAEQDRTGDDRLVRKMRSLSAPGLVVLTFLATFAFVDWIMSLEPNWFSTIYGAMFLVGEMVESFAFVIALVVILSKISPLKEIITPQHIHDLGNMMFAFMVLWAYLSFSQFIIIWSGNLPEEIPWYLNRLRGGWGWVALAVVIFHFAVPFALLLLRAVKRKEDRLFRVCMLLILIRLVDVFWITEPAFFKQHLRVHWIDFVIPVAIGGLWLSVFFWQLRSRPLLPVRDPRVQGAPRETVAF